MDFGNWQRSINESLKSDKYTILEQRDKNGRIIIEGDMDDFLNDLHCISLEDANKKFNDIAYDMEKNIIKNRQELEKQLEKKKEYTVYEAKQITKDYIKKLYDSIE